MVRDLFEKAFSYQRANLARASGLYPFFKPVSENAGSHVTIEGRDILMMGSNNYLGLTLHPKVIEAANEAQNKFGTSCSGSRYANGTYDIHVTLEKELAEWLGREEAICFTTGYMANVGGISAVTDRHDIIYSDKENHACIHDAVSLSMAMVKRFAHNDVNDLERVIQCAPESAGRLIVTDGVFSMRGSICDLPGLVEIKKKYGARIYVDDAHGFGVLGGKGEGTASYFGLDDEVDLVMGTFSKSLGGLGGFVAGDHRVIDFIRHTSRSHIFAASMTPASTAAVLQSLRMIRNEPEHLDKLRAVTRRAKDGFRSIGLPVPDNDVPIVYIRVGSDENAFLFWQALYDAGVYTNPVVSPGIPVGWSGVRVSFMSLHSDAEIDKLVETVSRCGEKFDLSGVHQEARSGAA